MDAASYNVAGIAGTAAAGALAGFVGADVAMAATIAVCVAALALIARVPMPAPYADDPLSVARAVVTGTAHLARTPGLRSVTVATTVSFFGVGALPVAFPLLAGDLGSTASASGALFSAF